MLRRFDLDRSAAMLAGSDLHGERKLLDVAVAYALRPKLLFLDEPTSGVSTREKAPIMDIVTSIVRAGDHGGDHRAQTWTSSSGIPNASLSMHQGTILADGTPDEIAGMTTSLRR